MKQPSKAGKPSQSTASTESEKASEATSKSEADRTAAGAEGDSEEAAPSAGGGDRPAARSGADRPSGAAAKDTVVGRGELRSSADVRTGFISGIRDFGVKKIRYANVDGMGIFEGDIAIGPVDKLDKSNAAADAAGLTDRTPASGSSRTPPNVAFAVAITGQRYRWPGALIPYQVQPDLADTVAAAIQHWEEKTRIRFVARTPENAQQYPNYVSFEVREGCWSAVGMQGGEQVISLGQGCGLGQAIHEIGHTVGLWHEQSREDRDQFVRIAWENILPAMEHNFDQHVTDGDDIGAYDYASIMHYPPKAFSANGLDTIVTLGGEEVGQRFGLSDGDIAAVAELYPEALGARHIYTTSLIELANAVKDEGFRSDGVQFYAFAAPVPGAVPLYRLSREGGKQLHTTSLAEGQKAISEGYTYDGVSGYVFDTPAFGLAPLYRVDKPEQQDHLLTMSPTEAQQAITQSGYADPAVAGYVLPAFTPGAVAVYRLSKSG